MQTNQFLYTQLPRKEDYSYDIVFQRYTSAQYSSQGGNIRHLMAYREMLATI